MGVRGIGGGRLRLHFVSYFVKNSRRQKGFWPLSCLSTPNLHPLGASCVSRLCLLGWDWPPVTALGCVLLPCPASQEACAPGRHPRGREPSFDKHLVRVASTAVKWE